MSAFPIALMNPVAATALTTVILLCVALGAKEKIKPVHTVQVLSTLSPYNGAGAVSFAVL